MVLTYAMALAIKWDHFLLSGPTLFLLITSIGCNFQFFFTQTISFFLLSLFNRGSNGASLCSSTEKPNRTVFQFAVRSFFFVRVLLNLHTQANLWVHFWFLQSISQALWHSAKSIFVLTLLDKKSPQNILHMENTKKIKLNSQSPPLSKRLVKCAVILDCVFVYNINTIVTLK